MSEPGAPEVRIDQLTGLRTILAAGRSDRPFDFTRAERDSGREAACPFCEGREDRTPPELWADRPGGGGPDTPGWRVRSVPNLYPALAGDRPEAGGGGAAKSVDPLRASARGGEPDLFSSAPATGVHEVIVHSPRHRRSIGELEADELEAALAGWRERMHAHSGAACTQLIVNEGAGAGASLEHSHAQLYARDFVPAAVARERERFSAYNQQTQGGDLLADIAGEEVRRAERLVAIDDEALLICPWASRSPFELRLLPRRAAARFEEDKGGAEMLATALGALQQRFGELPELNLWVRTAPQGAERFHWHLDIAPRLAVKAGVELATGVDINIYPPERAASELRDCLPPS
ncbi:MAG: galactose-1-phosphate uridylyltransferase [Allosphingosinicella sp.]